MFFYESSTFSNPIPSLDCLLFFNKKHLGECYDLSLLLVSERDELKIIHSAVANLHVRCHWFIAQLVSNLQYRIIMAELHLE